MPGRVAQPRARVHRVSVGSTNTDVPELCFERAYCCSKQYRNRTAHVTGHYPRGKSRPNGLGTCVAAIKEAMKYQNTLVLRFTGLINGISPRLGFLFVCFVYSLT